MFPDPLSVRLALFRDEKTFWITTGLYPHEIVFAVNVRSGISKFSVVTVGVKYVLYLMP